MASKKRGRKKKAPKPMSGLCLPPSAYLWTAASITLVVLIVGVVLIVRGEKPAAVCTALTALGVVAADIIRSVLVPVRRTA